LGNILGDLGEKFDIFGGNNFGQYEQEILYKQVSDSDLF
jgi:hypothetical protein